MYLSSNDNKSIRCLKAVEVFFEEGNLDWMKLCGCCTDGAPAMIGSKSGFQTLVKKKSPQVKGMHCMIHRQSLASKTLPRSLENTLDEIIQIVNFVKGSALNSRLFKQLCAAMDADHQVLLYHTKVRWLSKGNVTERVFELRDELKIFCQEQNKLEFISCLDDAEWVMRLGYLTDIFGQLNKLNLQMQGRNTNIIKFVDSFKAFIDKLGNWKQKVALNNMSMFEKLDMVLDESNNEIPSSIQRDITAHLTALEDEFKCYFPEVTSNELDMVRNPFRFSVQRLPDVCQDEFLELKNDSTAKDAWEEKEATDFWALMQHSYPKVTEIAIRALLPFVSTYLCESGFSMLLNIKTKQRNKLDVEPDLRCAMSSTNPRIDQLVKDKNCHSSH